LTNLDKKVIAICLSRVSRIWLIKQVLDPDENLLNSNSWSPALTKKIWNNKAMKSVQHHTGLQNDCKAYAILIKDRKADCSRRIDIWVEETLGELALGRLARVILTEMKGQREVSTFPISLQKK